MSRVICPYTKLNPLTEQALRDSGHPVKFVHTPDPHGYWKLLSNLWREGETILLVEHDILPWPGALDELLACPGLWCSNSYKCNGGIGIHHAFGCTKITAEFMDLLPDVWEHVADRHWSKLDAQLFWRALQAGQTPHPHRPPVIHLKNAA